MNRIVTDVHQSLQLLEHLTQHPSERPATLIVCSSRLAFFHQIAQQVQHQSQNATDAEAEPPVDAEQIDSESDHVPKAHPFERAALSLLAASRDIRLVYCPTIPLLRGYLASRCVDTYSPSTGIAHMIILDLLALHHGTSEFTLQGLGRTLATAVSAAHRAKCHLSLVECKDNSDPDNPDRGAVLWDRQVPLLSASVKIGLEGSRWAGRGIAIAHLASRWFRSATLLKDTEIQAADSTHI
jgi:hypothetical protein